MVTRAGPSRWPRRLTQIIFGLVAIALAVGGVAAVDRIARDSLGPHDRYLVPFSAIECPAPPGQSRVEFLGEVQYNGPFPDQVNVLDPTLPERLRAAFAAHKRVAKVGKVEFLATKRILVELTFRP